MTGLISHWLVQPVTIIPQNVLTTNAYGDEVRGPGTPVATTGYLYQQTSTENLDDRDTIVSAWYCDLHAEDVIGPLDQVTFGSQTFYVDGAPQNLWNPRTQLVDHIECRLVVVQG